MPKHIASVPKLDDFKAPWETDAGEDAEIDKSKLKKWIHNLITDKAKAQDARDEAVEKIAAFIADNSKLKEEIEKADGKDATAKIAKVERERDEAIANGTKTQDKLDRLEIAVEKGLTPSQAKRLVGETREELEKDAEALIEDLGIKPGEPKDDDEEDDDVHVTPRPVRPLTNGGDNNNGADEDPDFEKIAAELDGARVF